MAYSKHTWTDYELITKEKLNNIENGIENIEITPGEDGNTWYFGQNAPDSSLGKDGDLYYRYSNYDVLKKVGGSWQAAGNLKGSVQDATLEVKGIVKMASAAGTISTADIETAISGTQGDDTLNAMRNLLNETKNKLNEVITKLKNAGIMEQ